VGSFDASSLNVFNQASEHNTAGQQQCEEAASLNILNQIHKSGQQQLAPEAVSFPPSGQALDTSASGERQVAFNATA